MKELTVFNKDVIPVYPTDTGEKIVIGRELHERVKIGKDYSTWFKDMCGLGFYDKQDLKGTSQNNKNIQSNWVMTS